MNATRGAALGTRPDPPSVSVSVGVTVIATVGVRLGVRVGVGVSVSVSMSVGMSVGVLAERVRIHLLPRPGFWVWDVGFMV